MKQVVEMKKLEPAIREIIGAGGNVKLTVTGHSMLPTLAEHRDSVILEKAEKLKKGDIILYQRTNGDYVLHRIVKIKKDELYLCGDNQLQVEHPIYKNQVIAVVSAIFRKGEKIDIKSPIYRIGTFFWTNFIPLRPIMFKTVKKLKK